MLAWPNKTFYFFNFYFKSAESQKLLKSRREDISLVKKASLLKTCSCKNVIKFLTFDCSFNFINEREIKYTSLMSADIFLLETKHLYNLGMTVLKRNHKNTVISLFTTWFLIFVNHISWHYLPNFSLLFWCFNSKYFVNMLLPRF